MPQTPMPKPTGKSMRLIQAHDLQVRDIIVEKRGTRISHTTVERVERKLCGIHVNNQYCYNAPTRPVVVQR
jgi:hypothetical protein